MSDKYREGDRARSLVPCPDHLIQLAMLSTDGRFFTLDGSKLPGGRGSGEALRTFIDRRRMPTS